MSENETVVGSVNGPRDRIMKALEGGTELSMGNFIEVLDLDVVDNTFATVNVPDDKGGTVPVALTEAEAYALAIQDLIDAGAIHSQKGRGGGLKLGPKPPPSTKSAAAMALAKVRKLQR